MIKKSLFPIFILLLLIACDKSEDEIVVDDIETELPVFQNNYIKAKVGAHNLIIYEDYSLNNDTLNSFSFSFGQTITEFDDSDMVDTCLTLSGYLNKEQLMISFPLDKKARKYDIIRSFGPYSNLDGFYSNTIDFEKKEGFLTFETNNFLKEDILESKVGEIEITTLDWKNREVEGTFSFQAFGYHHDWKESVTKISAVDSMVTITEGAFFYRWSEELKIGYQE